MRPMDKRAKLRATRPSVVVSLMTLLLFALSACGSSGSSSQVDTEGTIRQVSANYLSLMAAGDSGVCDLLSEGALVRLAASSGQRDPSRSLELCRSLDTGDQPFNAQQLRQAADGIDSAPVEVDAGVATVGLAQSLQEDGPSSSAATSVLVLLDEDGTWKVDVLE